MKHIIYCPVCGKKNKLKQYRYVDHMAYGSTKRKRDLIKQNYSWIDFTNSKYLEVVCSCNAHIEFSIIKRKSFLQNNFDTEYSAYLSYYIGDYGISITILSSNNGKFSLNEITVYNASRIDSPILSKTDFNFYPKNKNELLALLMLS